LDEAYSRFGHIFSLDQAQKLVGKYIFYEVETEFSMKELIVESAGPQAIVHHEFGEVMIH